MPPQAIVRTEIEPETSIATRIILLVFFATFASAVAVSWISLETTRRQLWAEIHREEPALAARTGSWFLRWLAEGRALAADLAHGEASRVALASAAASAEHRRKPTTEVASMLAAAAGRSRQLHAFALLDQDGRPVLETAGMPALHPSERESLARPDGPFVRSLPRSEGPPLLVTATSVRSAGRQPAGWLVGAYRLDALRDALLSERLDPATRIALLDGSGAVLVSAGLPGDDPHLLVPGPEPGAGVVEYTNAAGEHVIGLARPLGALGFRVVVERSHETAFAPLLSALRWLVFIDLGIVLVASLVAYALTASMIRPLEALTERARRIAEGGEAEELPDSGRRDEIALLAQSFNEMIRRVERSQADLEAANHRLRSRNERLEASNEVLEQLAITDGLTKLHNHRFFQDHLGREIKRTRRTGEPLSLILVDLDDFKRLNDRLGHAAGDSLLRQVARVLSETVRDSDLVARYGGEEFAIVASGTDRQGAVVLAEKVRRAIETTPFAVDESPRPLPMTASAGVAEYKGDRKALFDAADRALYRAKDEGKNRVAVAEDAPHP
jgi:diguanylate cyclase (GGDEF)-like protein